jgi:hypothetical protein
MTGTVQNFWMQQLHANSWGFRSTGAAGPVVALALLLFGVSGAEAHAGSGAKQGQGSQALGSLTARGTVTVNGMPASNDTTVFVGDTIRTSEDGTVTFSINGKGSFRLASSSEMSFQPDPRYTGELKSGIVVMNSFGGATDISVRAGNYVVAPVIQAQQSSSRIERHVDGSFAIACLDGSVGLIPLEGSTGRVLQAGESANILTSGQLEAVLTPPKATTPAESASTNTPGAPTAPDTQPPPPPVHGSSSKKNEYILLGVAAAAAIGVAVGVAGAGHGSPSVSPSTP